MKKWEKWKKETKETWQLNAVFDPMINTGSWTRMFFSSNVFATVGQLAKMVWNPYVIQ